MRLRLVHTLSLTLLAFAGLAVLALGGLTAWNLRNGFGNYLAARDVAHLDRFSDVVGAAAARPGGLSDLLQGRLDLRTLLDELNPPPLSLPGPQDRRPPPGPASDHFPDRVQVVALDGRVLVGSPLLAGKGGAGPVVERPVRVNGEVVALARMRPKPLVRDGGEARFLHDQYRVIAAGSVGLMVLALLTAALLARRWTRPLAAVQDATQRLARGELTVRLPAGPDLADRGDEIGDVVRNVNRMAEGLQRLEGARRRWLADISHELRTPLTVLRGDIEALQDGVRPLRIEAIGVLHDEVLRIGKLVEDLHLLATSDLQALPCRFAPTDALDLLQRVARRFEGRARAAGLSVSLHWPAAPTTPAVPVNWDADRIEQLLANLMENSLRYTDAPGQICIGLQHADDKVTLVVEDSAPGVPADQWSQLFEPLYRGDAARARLHGGSGLGLAICEAIARAHGGQLRASASTLGGLRITVSLLLNAQAPTAMQPQADSDAGARP
ncbi:ATP-binding protein [Ideonella sp.]|uniref:ATP-binding protein n=1 Tax=Ideonella sp. TaxID=1929293 RepID=UPI003BB7FC5B